MQKNLYYRTVFQRQNLFKKFFLDLFLSIASYPRLLLEVFIRKNFGERYFSFATAITIAILLALFPLASSKLGSLFSGGYGYGRYGNHDSGISWSKFATWYVFLAAFVFFSYKRWQEVKRNPSVFDFGRFSLCTGDIHPFFFGLKIGGKPISVRAIEILCEPSVFFAAGILLWLLSQPLGGLLVFSSIFYALGYAGAYRNGDNFVMDKIDEMILNQETERAFIEDEATENTRGVRFYAKKPNSRELREQVADSMIEDDDAVEAV